MKPDPALLRLSDLAAMLRDAKLAELEAAQRACATSRMQLAALSTPAVITSDLSPTALAEAGLRYDRWAEARRAEINRVLARQTAVWLEAQAAARLAFGRADVLRKLAERRKG